MITIKDMSKIDLEKYKVKKRSCNLKYLDYDLIVTKGRNNNIYINFYAPVFHKYNYITFFVVDNILLMELSKEILEDSYTLTRKNNTSMASKIAGASAKELEKFVGKYRQVRFWNSTKSNPILYVELQ